MPVDAALIAARLGKPGDLRHPVTDRDQKHPTVSAATQANTRDLAKWHVDHAARSQPVARACVLCPKPIAATKKWLCKQPNNHIATEPQPPSSGCARQAAGVRQAVP